MPSAHPSPEPLPPAPWLIRIPPVFAPATAEILGALGSLSDTLLGQDYHLIKTADPGRIHQSPAASLVSWNLPIHHSWPCNPRTMDGFIEKAAQTLARKFAGHSPQGIFIGPLNAAAPDRYYKALASNLRGRVLQLFPSASAAEVEEQDPSRPSLFGLVGREGLFCGVSTPRSANGFYPGGSKFISHNSPDTISRAGAKIAEALHYLGLHRPPLPAGAHWLELGACPGGMTSELLARGQRVTAIDRAPLDPRLNGRPGLTFIQQDVMRFQPPPAAAYDALLCDMNGPPRESMEQVCRLTPALKKGALLVFTLKLPKVEDAVTPNQFLDKISRQAAAAGLHRFAVTHLTCNGHELTLFFERDAPAKSASSERRGSLE